MAQLHIHDKEGTGYRKKQPEPGSCQKTALWPCQAKEKTVDPQVFSLPSKVLRAKKQRYLHRQRHYDRCD